LTQVHRGEARREKLWIDGIPLTSDAGGGQKTGLYIDQLDDYRRASRPLRLGAEFWTVLPIREVSPCIARAVEPKRSSPWTSVAAHWKAARETAVCAGLLIHFEEANVFDKLKSAQAAGEQFDLIILDPPSFTRSRANLNEALRGYQEIHLRALRMLEPGEFLPASVAVITWIAPPTWKW